MLFFPHNTMLCSSVHKHSAQIQVILIVHMNFINAFGTLADYACKITVISVRNVADPTFKSNLGFGLHSQHCMSCPKYITETVQEVMSFLTSLLSAPQRWKLQPSVCSILSTHPECLHWAPSTHQVLSPWRKENCPSEIKVFFQDWVLTSSALLPDSLLYILLFPVCRVWLRDFRLPSQDTRLHMT